MFASTPAPRISRQSVTSRRGKLCESLIFSFESGRRGTPPSEAKLAIAWLMGWVEERASAAARLAISELRTPDSELCAATSGFPTVNVPVLSKITAVIVPAFSSATPSRIRMPRRAAALALAMMAAGVARPIAHGHATIKTAAAMMKPAAAPVGDITCQRNGASRSWMCFADSGMKPHHNAATTAMATTTGTKTLLTWSPRRWMSARLVWARCTAAMMWASAVLSPVAVTRMTSRPFRFTVPA